MSWSESVVAPVSVPAFGSAFEMAGFYAAHMLLLLDVEGRAPTQVALLGPESGQRSVGLDARLRGLARRELLFELVREHAEPETMGLAVVGLSGRHRQRSFELLVQAFDVVDGVGADFVVRAQRSRMTERLMVSPPELIDLVGAALDAREFTRMGCIIDFETGMSRLPLIYGALQPVG